MNHHCNVFLHKDRSSLFEQPISISVGVANKMNMASDIRKREFEAINTFRPVICLNE